MTIVLGTLKNGGVAALCAVCGRRRNHTPDCDPVARFHARTVQRGECIEWTGARTEFGHGVVWWNGALRLAHRIGYMLANGEIPDGLNILHSCDNPPCVNPAHLRPGTQSDNTNDAYARGRCNNRRSGNSGKTHCKHGHEFTPENTYWNAKGRTCRACTIASGEVSRLRRRIGAP